MPAALARAPLASTDANLLLSTHLSAVVVTFSGINCPRAWLYSLHLTTLGFRSFLDLQTAHWSHVSCITAASCGCMCCGGYNAGRYNSTQPIACSSHSLDFIVTADSMHYVYLFAGVEALSCFAGYACYCSQQITHWVWHYPATGTTGITTEASWLLLVDVSCMYISG